MSRACTSAQLVLLVLELRGSFGTGGKEGMRRAKKKAHEYLLQVWWSWSCTLPIILSYNSGDHDHAHILSYNSIQKADAVSWHTLVVCIPLQTGSLVSRLTLHISSFKLTTDSVSNSPGSLVSSSTMLVIPATNLAGLLVIFVKGCKDREAAMGLDFPPLIVW